jgi:FkbM family methyltransferase
MTRLKPASKTKRALVNIANEHLQDVAYARLKEAGFNPGGIIDVGASFGSWSTEIRRIFPVSPILMIEARATEEFLLKKTCVEIGNASCEIALLGAHESEASFAVNALNASGSSLFPERSNVPRETAALPMSPLDSLIELHRELCGPLLLKLDVQGAELEVLKGARQTLRSAEVLQLEVALLPYNEGAPLAAEVISYLDEAGFAIFDVIDFVRPADRHLVQMDLLFVREGSRLRPVEFVY